MMNTIVGSALGGLVAAAIALVASGQARSAPAPYWDGDPNAARAITAADTRALNDGMVYYQPRAVYAEPRPVTRTVARPAARERVVYTQPREEDRRSGRSWGKTAMIIGGGTGAGAGMGGLIAGKKGALIGAAIGGGAATIYESTKR